MKDLEPRGKVVEGVLCEMPPHLRDDRAAHDPEALAQQYTSAARGGFARTGSFARTGLGAIFGGLDL